MDNENRSDAELWLEATSGTEASFSVLYNRHRTRVFRKAYSQVGNVSDAEDVVAVVFLEAWRSRQKVRIVDGSVLPWLLAVTTNATLNNLRSSRRYRRLIAAIPASELVRDPADEAGERLDTVDGAKRLRDAMLRLSPVERTIVDLCLMEELPMSVVARVLELPVGTVKSRLSRSRQKLRTILGDADLTVKEPSALRFRGGLEDEREPGRA